MSLFIGQAFLYNAIFFTYGLVLAEFYGVDAASIPLYIFPFAAGNLLGPLLLGRFFDTIGRRPMIAGTYILSGGLLIVSGFLFQQGVLNATTQTIAWVIIFFFASAGASAAYLTVSEIFPIGDARDGDRLLLRVRDGLRSRRSRHPRRRRRSRSARVRRSPARKPTASRSAQRKSDSWKTRPESGIREVSDD